MEICLEVYADSTIAAAKRTNKEVKLNVPELIRELHGNCDDVVLAAGFDRYLNLSDKLSTCNGDISYYDVYYFESDENRISLVTDVRTSNHLSKPDLA